MNESMKRYGIIGAAVVACLVAIVVIRWASTRDGAGFQAAQTGASGAVSTQNVQQRIQEVQDNPRIPAEQKARIISSMRLQTADRPGAQDLARVGGGAYHGGAK